MYLVREMFWLMITGIDYTFYGFTVVMAHGSAVSGGVNVRHTIVLFFFSSEGVKIKSVILVMLFLF